MSDLGDDLDVFLPKQLPLVARLRVDLLPEVLHGLLQQLPVVVDAFQSQSSLAEQFRSIKVIITLMTSLRNVTKVCLIRAKARMRRSSTRVWLEEPKLTRVVLEAVEGLRLGLARGTDR